MSNQASEFAIQAVLSTDDVEGLSAFCAEVFDAEEELRVPGRKGPFFVTFGSVPRA